MISTTSKGYVKAITTERQQEGRGRNNPGRNHRATRLTDEMQEENELEEFVWATFEFYREKLRQENINAPAPVAATLTLCDLIHAWLIGTEENKKKK